MRNYKFPIRAQAKERASKGRSKLATRTWEDLVSESAREQNEVMGWLPYEIPIVLSVDIYTLKPTGDLSNCLKSVEDALNGIAYTDDRLIHQLKARFVKNDCESIYVSICAA